MSLEYVNSIQLSEDKFINLTDNSFHNGFCCYRVGFSVKLRAEHRCNSRIIICRSYKLIPCSSLALTSSAFHLHRADFTKWEEGTAAAAAAAAAAAQALNCTLM